MSLKYVFNDVAAIPTPNFKAKPMMRTPKFSCILLFALIITSGNIFASHIMGGALTYTFIDSATPGRYHYKIRLTLYENCLTGEAEAIALDNPAYLTIYQGGSVVPAIVDTTVSYTSSSLLPVDYVTPCGTYRTPASGFCGIKKIFEKDYYLPPYSGGYNVAFQLCCRNFSLVNVIDPGVDGATYFCNIPPAHMVNTSALYNQSPPFVVCAYDNLVYDLGATDADGDSLSYELSPCYYGARNNEMKPVVASHPPYDPVPFVPGFSFSSPMGNAPFICDPVSGRLTITPGFVGIYLIGISCKEWRHGVLINTNTTEFSCLVINCSEGAYAGWNPNAGNDTIIFTGDSVHFNATGGVSFAWSPPDYLDNPKISDPVGTFTTPGIVTYVITTVNDSGCTGRDTLHINVIDHPCFVVPNAFTPNGDNRNDKLIPLPVKNAVLKNFNIYNRYGNRVFSTSSPSEGWDGKYNGKEQSLGVYTWEIQYEYNNGTPGVQSGNVTLLR